MPSKRDVRPNYNAQYAFLGLHQAALSGNVGLVRYALSEGQPVDAVWDGISALHAAAAGGSEHVARLLIDNGADVNFGRQPMSERELKTRTASSSSSSPPIIDMSVEMPVAAHAAEALLHPGSTPLHFACAHNSAAVARLLLAYGAAPHIPDKRGVTPLELLPPAPSPSLTAPSNDFPLPSTSNSTTSTPAQPDTLRTIIREYYENEKAKEKEYQKNHIRFHGKAAAVLGFPHNANDDDIPAGTKRVVAGKRSMDGLIALSVAPVTPSPKHVPVPLNQMTPSPARRAGITATSPPPSPKSPSHARYTFGTATLASVSASASASTSLGASVSTPSHINTSGNKTPPSDQRRPSLPHVFLPSSSPSSSRPRSADETDPPPPFNSSGSGSGSGNHLHARTTTTSTTTATLPPISTPPARPRTKRSLLSLFKKGGDTTPSPSSEERERELERERERERASFSAMRYEAGASASMSAGAVARGEIPPPMLRDRDRDREVVHTAPAGQTTFGGSTTGRARGGERERIRMGAGISVPDEVFVDDEEDYGVPLMRTGGRDDDAGLFMREDFRDGGDGEDIDGEDGNSDEGSFDASEEEEEEEDAEGEREGEDADADGEEQDTVGERVSMETIGRGRGGAGGALPVPVHRSGSGRRSGEGSRNGSGVSLGRGLGLAVEGGSGNTYAQDAHINTHAEPGIGSGRITTSTSTSSPALSSSPPQTTSPRMRPGILRGRGDSAGAMRRTVSKGALRFQGDNEGMNVGVGGDWQRERVGSGARERERGSPSLRGGSLREYGTGSGAGGGTATVREKGSRSSLGGRLGAVDSSLRLRGDSLSSASTDARSYDTSMGTASTTATSMPDMDRDETYTSDEEGVFETPGSGTGGGLGLSIRTVSSHAEAEALVQKAAKEILELGSAGEAMSLSAQLAAYGETLQLERRFARGEAQRWKTPPTATRPAVGVSLGAAGLDGEEDDGEAARRREEERRKRAQEQMMWSQRTMDQYTRGASKERRSPEIIRDRERELIGRALARTTSLEKEMGAGEVAALKKQRPPKVRRPHTSDSVRSTGSGTVPKFGHSSTNPSGNLLRVKETAGVAGSPPLRVFQTDRAEPEPQPYRRGHHHASRSTSAQPPPRSESFDWDERPSATSASPESTSHWEDNTGSGSNRSPFMGAHMLAGHAAAQLTVSDEFGQGTGGRAPRQRFGGLRSLFGKGSKQ